VGTGENLSVASIKVGAMEKEEQAGNQGDGALDDGESCRPWYS
jgi:hypothetical protein